MNILFIEIAPPNMGPEMCSDYQLDMLFHGLVTSGHTVYTLHDHWWMLESEKKNRPEDFKKIWGKGFTIYGTINNDDKRHIKNIGFADICMLAIDLCIAGIHHTVAGRDETVIDALNIINTKMGISKDRTVVVDGWDRPHINKEIAENYTYFKRELYDEYIGLAKPVSFAFPIEKIPQVKTHNEVFKWICRSRPVAPLIPVNQSIDPEYMKTYKYDTEEEYYKMYQESEFALTSKKGGWDTLRHYEIIANGCIPIFVDIEKCPTQTLHLFPKDLCITIKKADLVHLNYKDGTTGYPRVLENCACIDIDKPGYITEPIMLNESQKVNKLKCDISNRLREWITTKGTTKYLAEYVLNNA